MIWIAAVGYLAIGCLTMYLAGRFQDDGNGVQEGDSQSILTGFLLWPLVLPVMLYDLGFHHSKWTADERKIKDEVAEWSKRDTPHADP